MISRSPTKRTNRPQGDTEERRGPHSVRVFCVRFSLPPRSIPARLARPRQFLTLRTSWASRLSCWKLEATKILAIAALLHDVVEDCGGAPMLKEVRRRFGARVAKVVDGCTDSDTYPKAPWLERKEKYIARLKKENADTRLVSAADKLNNVRSILSDYRAIGESVWSRFHGGREGTLWYYRTLRDEFLRHKPNRITRELELGGKRTGVAGRGSIDFRWPMSTTRHRGMNLWRARSIKFAHRNYLRT